MKILYFAFLRQRTGLGEETVDAPAGVRDVAGLVEWLKTRGPGHAEALKDVSAVRVAVNQEFAGMDTLIAANDEIAFFPPVTGG
ncbi:MAG: molybdopterin converting factor subunit 1 [Alphaproteobacteria bacterium]|jgi:molybdopterin synthase sulfur carrier subunit|nr:molybdopterin converting factor subunit 1 [Alphaproteobacteria bacterium]